VIVSIHQPQFMPWLGYFEKMDRADGFVLLDNVQYKKNEWQNRNRIKSAQGAQWLTVPVHFRFPAKILEVAADPAPNWRRKHWQALLTNYAKAPYWGATAASLESFYQQDWGLLKDLNWASIEWIRERLGIKTPLYWASEMDLSEDPTQRLLDICRTLGADTYLAGPDGREYMETDKFVSAGIEVIFQQYEPVSYAQLFGDFVSHLSALDLLLNCGDESLRVLRAGKKD
jgi:hypothetical protein